ncbi:hypothetical protein [Mycoplasma buteonis]|uniref:hypothetical protein n=1 Tax=Mycoplasma buteonis TaxID=171280 RepID=UPI00056342FF|nr:hypothetical protein [Mycoplasma buteonis]
MSNNEKLESKTHELERIKQQISELSDKITSQMFQEIPLEELKANQPGYDSRGNWNGDKASRDLESLKMRKKVLESEIETLKKQAEQEKAKPKVNKSELIQNKTSELEEVKKLINKLDEKIKGQAFGEYQTDIFKANEYGYDNKGVWSSQKASRDLDNLKERQKTIENELKALALQSDEVEQITEVESYHKVTSEVATRHTSDETPAAPGSVNEVVTIAEEETFKELVKSSNKLTSEQLAKFKELMSDNEPILKGNQLISDLKVAKSESTQDNEKISTLQNQLSEFIAKFQTQLNKTLQSSPTDATTEVVLNKEEKEEEKNNVPNNQKQTEETKEKQSSVSKNTLPSKIKSILDFFKLNKEDFKNSLQIINSDFIIPQRFKILYKSADVDYIYNKIAVAVFLAADNLINNKASYLKDALNDNLDDFIDVITKRRYELFREAIFNEINFRLLNESIPELATRQRLASSNLNLYNDGREFSFTEQYLNPLALRMLINANFDTLYNEINFNLEQNLKLYDKVNKQGDKLTELEQLTANDSEKLEALKEKLSTLKELADKLEENKIAANLKTSALDSSITKLEAELTHWTSETLEYKSQSITQLEAFTNDINELKKDVEDVKNKSTGFLSSAEFFDNLARIDGQIFPQITELQNQLRDFKGNINDNYKDFESTKRELAKQINEANEDIKSTLESLKTKLQELETLPRQSGDGEAVNLTPINNKIREIETKLNKVPLPQFIVRKPQFDELVKKTNDNVAKTEQLSQRLTQAENLNPKVTQLEEQTNELKSKMEQLANTQSEQAPRVEAQTSNAKLLNIDGLAQWDDSKEYTRIAYLGNGVELLVNNQNNNIWKIKSFTNPLAFRRIFKRDYKIKIAKPRKDQNIEGIDSIISSYSRVLDLANRSIYCGLLDFNHASELFKKFVSNNQDFLAKSLLVDSFKIFRELVPFGKITQPINGAMFVKFSNNLSEIDSYRNAANTENKWVEKQNPRQLPNSEISQVNVKTADLVFAFILDDADTPDPTNLSTGFEIVLRWEK